MRGRIDSAPRSGVRSAAMQEFLDFVLRQLVDHPDEIVITHAEVPRKVVFKVQVEKSDVPKIIGKHGQTIAAIRNLLNAAGSRHGQRVYFDIVEENAPR